MAPLILEPSLMRPTGSAASMKSSYRELFLLPSAPFAVTCTTFIVTCNCNRNATHASTNLGPDTPVMLKRTFRHPVSPILGRVLRLREYVPSPLPRSFSFLRAFSEFPLEAGWD